MTREHEILVGVDGSTASLHALRWAAAEARARPPRRGGGPDPRVTTGQARGFSRISQVSMTSPSVMSLYDPRPIPHS